MKENDMNTIDFSTFRTLETYSGIFHQGLQSTTRWFNYMVTYIQTTSQTLASHPYAPIATIAVANTLFFLILNTTTQYIEGKFSNLGTRNYKVIVISELCAAASVWGFNIFLSKVTKVQINPHILAGITITSLTLRLIFTRTQFTTSQQEEQKTPQILKNEDLDLQDVFNEKELDSSIDDTEVISLKTQLAKIEEQLVEEKNKRIEQELEINKQATNILNLQEQLSKLSEENEEIKSEITVEESAKKANQNVSALEHDFQEKQTELAQVRDQLEQSENDKTQALKQLKKEQQKFKNQLEEMQQQINTLTIEKQTLTEIIVLTKEKTGAKTEAPSTPTLTKKESKTPLTPSNFFI